MGYSRPVVTNLEPLGYPFLWEFSLSAPTAVGATTLVLDRSAAPLVTSRDLLAVIDPGTVTCEVRQVASLGGSLVTVQSALDFVHSSAVRVWMAPDDSLNLSLWGANGANNNAVDDWAAVQAGINQTQKNACWSQGLGNFHVTRQPLFGSNGTRLRGASFKAHPTLFVGAEATNAMFMSSQNNWLRFTADASTDTITTAASHGGNVNQKIAFNAPQGQTLPGGIVAGRVYFIKTVPTGTTMTISETLGGATFDITSDGTGGICYSGITSLERVFFEQVYFAGNSVAGLNGCSLFLQQPAYTRDLRIDGCPGYGLIIGGQISNHYSLELGPHVDGDALALSGVGVNFFGVNITSSPSGGGGLVIGAGLAASAQGCNFFGLWTEQCQPGIRWAGTGTAIGIFGWYCALGAGQTGLQVDAAVAAVNRGYFVTGARFGSSTDIVLNDDTTTVNVLASRFPQLAPLVLRQEPGTSRPSLYLLNGSAALNFGSVAANSTSTALTITVTGATVGDRVTAHADALEDGLAIGKAWVSSANTVSIKLVNVTTGAIDPALQTFSVEVEGMG